MFDELFQRVGPTITKEHTNCRSALEPGLKLAITEEFGNRGQILYISVPVPCSAELNQPTYPRGMLWCSFELWNTKMS
jgi:hypothetical protein